MAKTEHPTLRGENPIIDEFVKLSLTLIEAAGVYAEGGQYDAESDANMRRLRVTTAALDAALNNIGITRPMVIQPPPGPVEPVLGLGVENRIAALESRMANVETHEGVVPPATVPHAPAPLAPVPGSHAPPHAAPSPPPPRRPR